MQTFFLVRIQSILYEFYSLCMKSILILVHFFINLVTILDDSFRSVNFRLRLFKFRYIKAYSVDKFSNAFVSYIFSVKQSTYKGKI